ncbi:MAG: ribosome maturation factor RimP [Clostridia bacterium]|nr:ribosome maturation factor RimP [Clostridia bacterium]
MKVKSNSEILEFCAKIGQTVGVEVVEVEFKQGKNPTLTIFIDREGGIDLDACETFHRAINDPLDELDPTFGEPYTLNVSSLGADRPFKTEKDFNSHIGKMVEVKLNVAIKGKKYYEGELLSYDGDRIVLKVDAKNTLSIELKSIVKVNSYIDFN